MNKIRTRFAPSPTGYLHVGSARTALFCWLYAKKHQGTFILRIEDTDLERSTESSIQAILDGMNYLALDYDEGPFYQTKRFDRYFAVIEQLLQEGKAYRCYCAKERLETLRNEQMANKEKPRYDGTCRHLNEQKALPFVVRFKNPLEGDVTFVDEVHGQITFANQELDDLIIARTDGSPTYNFTVVVDDWDMQITHVIRGDDHINNTPRQINMFKALEAPIPKYAHLPMILGNDGKRLSKRHGAMSVLEYAKEGYLPQALLNYLVRLGWSNGDQEIFSLEEMIAQFDLKGINKAAAAFNTDKLMWLNQHYLKTMDPNDLVDAFARQLQLLNVLEHDQERLKAIIECQRDRTKTLKEMAEKSVYFFEEPNLSDEFQALFTPEIKTAMKEFKERVSSLNEFNKETLHQTLKEVAELQKMKLGQLAQPLRIALTGGTVSPSLDITMYLIGKDAILARISNVIDK